jgi:anti-sigma-K factor RskA
VESLRDRLARSGEQMKGLKEAFSRQSEIVAFLRNPDVVVINLAGLEPKLDAKGRVLLDTQHNRALFYALNLPQVPSGKTYQLWVIADDIPKSAGIFKVNQQGNSMVEIETLPKSTEIQKFAVTLEPEGGLPQPSGEMYLIGNI